MIQLLDADRQDITPMERALSFQTQIEAKVFATQESLAEAIGLSKGQVAKMLKAAGVLKHATLASLFADKSAVPVIQAYNLGMLFERPGAKEVILQAAQKSNIYCAVNIANALTPTGCRPRSTGGTDHSAWPGVPLPDCVELFFWHNYANCIIQTKYCA